VTDRWRYRSQTGFGAQPIISASRNERVCHVRSS